MKPPFWSLWIIAFLVTAITLVYQRTTGPTYPARGHVTIGSSDVGFRLARSYDGPDDAPITVEIADPNVRGTLTYRRYKSHDGWTTQEMQREKNAKGRDQLVGRLPHQPPAGKVMYRVALTDATGRKVELTPEPLILRFRDPVPEPIVASHVLTIFSGMFFAMLTTLEVLRRGPYVHACTVLTVVFLFVGGAIFGPLMQKYAFDAFWTGWPFGHDLTDNKLAAVLIVWLITLWRSTVLRKRKQAPRGTVFLAAAVTIGVWLIPHSVLGSELDFTAMEAAAPGQPAATAQESAELPVPTPEAAPAPDSEPAPGAEPAPDPQRASDPDSTPPSEPAD